MKRPYILLFFVLVSCFALTSAYAQTADFFQLVTAGTPQDVQAAIDKGADVNAHQAEGGMTPLVAAAKYNPNLEVIAILLKAGADVKGKDDDGQTVLDYARNNYSLNGTDALKQLEEASK